jgi:hypothetical protein
MNLNRGSSCHQTSQFKHTLFWNSIIDNLKCTLVDLHNSNTKLKKQHSRFVAASVGGMLLIKQNLSMISNSYSTTTNNNNNNNATTISTESATKSSTCSSNSSSSSVDNIYFTGSQCVDIVYSYLTANHEALHLEREVTREKVIKVQLKVSLK